MLASLGLAIGALLAPVVTAPARANHITTFDNEVWLFHRYGSWYSIHVINCFTTNYEYLETVQIFNNGRTTHYFHWEWTDYYDNVKHSSGLFGIGAHGWQKWDFPKGSYGQSQVNHPRLKLSWVNNSNNWELLWDLNAWVAGSYDSAEYQEPAGGCS
jgi:hypothetical protein